MRKAAVVKSLIECRAVTQRDSLVSFVNGEICMLLFIKAAQAHIDSNRRSARFSVLRLCCSPSSCAGKCVGRRLQGRSDRA